MDKTELYSFALLNHLTKKVYEQNIKIELILRYIIEKNDLPDSMFDEINNSILESNIECMSDVQDILNKIDDSSIPNDFLK